MICGSFIDSADEASDRRVGAIGASSTFALSALMWLVAAEFFTGIIPGLQITVDSGEAAVGVGSCLVVWRAFLVDRQW